jgi:hypothetical protein
MCIFVIVGVHFCDSEYDMRIGRNSDVERASTRNMNQCETEGAEKEKKSKEIERVGYRKE